LIDSFKDPIRSKKLQIKYYKQRYPQILKHNIIICIILILMIAAKIVTLNDEEAYQEYFIQNERF